MKKWIDLGARLLLGLIFFVFGLNGFLNFIPVPEMPEEANAFMGALVASGYLLTLVKILETVSGLLLLVGRFQPLALLLLAPIVVNIFLFHVFLAPGGLPMAVIIVVLEAYLGFGVCRERFADVLRP